MPATLPAAVLALWSVLVPVKSWFAPNQPINIEVKPEGGAITLMLTDFGGRGIEAQGSAEVTEPKTVDVKPLFPQLAIPGTYILYAVPKSKGVTEFVGTPIVINVRDDKRRGAPPGPMVIKLEPLRYAVLNTEHGPVTLAFYYDVAPNTSANFLKLAEGEYFDGLTFHRIVPGFVLQGGDPRGDGTGGPGYMIDAEFSDRQHLPGVLSMARSGDPNEQAGAPPRSEFANSAGSQFFICLDYNQTRQLDGKYTAFGKVVSGMDAVNKIAKTPIADPQWGKPATPQMIKTVEVKAVSAGNNPYEKLSPGEATPTGEKVQ